MKPGRQSFKACFSSPAFMEDDRMPGEVTLKDFQKPGKFLSKVKKLLRKACVEGRCLAPQIFLKTSFIICFCPCCRLPAGNGNRETAFFYQENVVKI
jgi:hypothetical protein